MVVDGAGEGVEVIILILLFIDMSADPLVEDLVACGTRNVQNVICKGLWRLLIATTVLRLLCLNGSYVVDHTLESCHSAIGNPCFLQPILPDLIELVSEDLGILDLGLL